MKHTLLILFIFCSFCIEAKVRLGVDVFFEEEDWAAYKGKSVALLTNHTGVTKDLHPTLDMVLKQAGHWEIKAIFSPEHGLDGSEQAGKEVSDFRLPHSIPVYSLYGKNRRPTDQMLKGIDVIFCDIQDIGSRSYTYMSTLYYVMEEAARRGITIVIFDRPNPMGGNIVDGPVLSDGFRSFVGYVDVPYCHGMTMGELAKYFNTERQINCRLKVIPMRGWERRMSFRDTGLQWVPTSPNIPEQDTPFFYATTGILGELSIVNIGIGYTQPFKLVGAPWIDGKKLAAQLNAQKFPGVKFFPIVYRPLFGLYKNEECKGVKIFITDETTFKPVAVQYMLIGMLKSLYPQEFAKRIGQVSTERKKFFNLINGTDEIWNLMTLERYPAWKMVEHDKKEREKFISKRKSYLLY